jgi:hypothetical protein
MQGAYAIETLVTIIGLRESGGIDKSKTARWLSDGVEDRVLGLPNKRTMSEF